MESLWLGIITFSIAITLWIIFKKYTSSKCLPPGPRGWPFIGNILDVGMTPHLNLYNLRPKYGPILFLKLGMSNTLVVQSAKAAEELFKKLDLPFSDRTIPDSITACGYHKGSLVFAPYGPYWRTIRKISVTELFAQKRIRSSAQVRQTCVDNMIQWIKEDASASRANGGSGEIRFDKYIGLMSFNLVSNFLISKDILDSKSEKGSEFFDTMIMWMHWNGIPNLVDSFPFLKWVDPQGIRRNTAKYMRKLIKIIDGFVKERIHQEKLSGKKDSEKLDFLDTLLEYNGKGEIESISMENVVLVVLEMFLAGSETSNTTIVWAMAELLRNPDWIKKLKEEFDRVIGSRNVEEDDLNNLPYLQAVVKEVLRLHLPLPFLLPRRSRQDAEFMGYFIPKNTVILVNGWAIHRDPDSWEDPLLFKPDRFLNSNIEPKGKHFELLPFGSGRRSCVGMLLGDKMVGLTVARLIQSFDWKLPGDMSADALDMTEKVGIAVHKLVPLVAIPN